jgi:hypothetical protein
MSEQVDEFLARLSRMDADYLECRTLKHSWTGAPLRVVDTRQESSRVARAGHSVFAERRIRCSRCGMVRSDAFQISSSRGHTALIKINSTYPEIPPGYYVTGQGRLEMPLVLGAKFDRDTEAMLTS